MNKIGVLIVDDSAVVRTVLTDILSKDSSIEVIGSASDPIFAQKYMEKRWPDVIILDIEMPRMDGLTFLKKIMAERPTPVVICSTLTKEGTTTTFEALRSGAVDIITKPEIGLKGFLEETGIQFLNAVKGAASARVAKVQNIINKQEQAKPLGVAPKLTADAILPKGTSGAMSTTTDKVVAIGTSTGGTQALEIVLKSLPKTSPGIVVVQHMPENFTKAFANRLDSVCEISVKEAEDGDRVLPGLAIIARGNRHLTLTRSGAQYRVQVVDGPLVSRHRPSVDVLFRSVAREAGANAMGVIMTGMGDDGSSGLLEMREAGAYTLAQDEETCIVYGMPAEAVKKGAVDKIVSLYEIHKEIQKLK